MHLRKNGHSGSLSKVTKELQYANQNDTVPSQSFILFWLHNRLKLVIQGSHMVSGTRCPAWSDQVKKWSESRVAAPRADVLLDIRGFRIGKIIKIFHRKYPDNMPNAKTPIGVIYQMS